ncbi:hypothetical protein BKA93DRAFT_758166, partial [Sparassis latifolia]
MRLRNMASRVRKITEGYTASSAPVSPNISSSKARLPFTQSIPFLSARDTYRDVYLSRADAPSPCPNKRKHTILEEAEEELSDEDIDMVNDMDDDVWTGDASHSVPHSSMLNVRPMKPLRPARLRLTGTRSLPVGIFRFTDDANGESSTMPTSQYVEEDWSNHLAPSSGPAL